jgi:hypothetical protein
MILYPLAFISRSTSFVTSGLIMQLDAYDRASYSGSGTTVNDITGSYTHTLTGASFTILNGVRCFDCATGLNNRVVVNGTGPTLPTTGYTYITWARIIPNSVEWRSLLRANNNLPILVQAGTDDLGYYGSGGIVFQDSGYNVTSDEDVWVQYAVVGDNTSSIFYINGAQVGSVAYGAGGDTHVMWGNNGLAGQPFGHVANLFLYNRKLSVEEIIGMYNHLAPRFVTPVTSNLVLHYDPYQKPSYAGSGATVYDLTSNGLNGTLSNTTYTSPYLTYNGSSSQISVADNALLEPGSGDWTMEVWVNQEVAGNDVVLGKFNNTGRTQDVSYSIRTTGSTFYGQFSSGSGSGATLFVNSTNYTGTLNTWYQIVYVFTNVAANTLQTFVNGASIGSVSHSLSGILNSTNPLYIGSYNGGEFSQWFHGKIGIVRIYNKSLTSTEVLNNYNADKWKYQ